jgi:hypothetical protein
MKKLSKEEIIQLTPKCSGIIRERLYWIRNNLSDYPDCKGCNLKLSSKNFITNGKAGYRDYCGMKCCKRDQDYSASISKRTETNIKKYGGNSPWYFENFRKYVKERYGVEMIETQTNV